MSCYVSPIKPTTIFRLRVVKLRSGSFLIACISTFIFRLEAAECSKDGTGEQPFVVSNDLWLEEENMDKIGNSNTCLAR